MDDWGNGIQAGIRGFHMLLGKIIEEEEWDMSLWLAEEFNEFIHGGSVQRAEVELRSYEELLRDQELGGFERGCPWHESTVLLVQAWEYEIARRKKLKDEEE